MDRSNERGIGTSERGLSSKDENVSLQIWLSPLSVFPDGNIAFQYKRKLEEQGYKIEAFLVGSYKDASFDTPLKNVRWKITSPNTKSDPIWADFNTLKDKLRKLVDIPHKKRQNSTVNLFSTPEMAQLGEKGAWELLSDTDEGISFLEENFKKIVDKQVIKLPIKIKVRETAFGGIDQSNWVEIEIVSGDLIIGDSNYFLIFLYSGPIASLGKAVVVLKYDQIWMKKVIIAYTEEFFHNELLEKAYRHPQYAMQIENLVNKKKLKE